MWWMLLVIQDVWEGYAYACPSACACLWKENICLGYERGQNTPRVKIASWSTISYCCTALLYSYLLALVFLFIPATSPIPICFYHLLSTFSLLPSSFSSQVFAGWNLVLPSLWPSLLNISQYFNTNFSTDKPQMNVILLQQLHRTTKKNYFLLFSLSLLLFVSFCLLLFGLFVIIFFPYMHDGFF